MAQLHVVDDLGDRQARGADDPGRREEREQQDRAAGQLEVAVERNDLADVCRVVGSARIHDGLADGVELTTEGLDVGGRQVRGRVGTTGRLGVQDPLLAVDQTQVWVDAGVDRRGGGREGRPGPLAGPLARHRGVGRNGVRLGDEGHSVAPQCSISHAPAAADTQVWMATPSPGAAYVTSPVRRSRTAPSRSGKTHW